MQMKRIPSRTFLAFSVVVLLITNAVTYVMLLSKNEEWKAALSEGKKSEFDVPLIADAFTEHVYYDGDSIPCSQMVRHYSRSGKKIGNYELGELLHGDKIMLLLTSNSCSSCAKTEIDKMRKLAEVVGHEQMIIVADFSLHTFRSWAVHFEEEGYYETDTEHLGLKGSPTREAAMLMLVQDGRVKTSFPVMPQTSAFADWFHEYLSDYFKGKK